MTYRLGIDVGPARTTWAVIAGQPDRAPDTGAIDSVVTIVLRDDVIMAREFVDRLGQPEPIIIGGTPYGVEALLAKLVAGIVGSATQRQGEEPAAVVVVHPDGLDPYRAGLYSEALRLAGVPSGAAFVVSQSEALAARAGDDPAVGGAAVGWQRVPTPVDDDSQLGGAVVMGSGAAGAVVIASMVGEGLDAGVGLSSAAGPEGIGLAHAGPSGASIGSSGPAGTSLPGANATTGTPIAGPPAPPGTPMAAPGGAPTPQSGPPAPQGTPATSDAATTLTTGGATPPPPPPPPGGHGGLRGGLPEAAVRPGMLELAPGLVWWRRWWFFAVVFVALLFVAVPVVFLMGRSDSARSVAPASTVARVLVTTTTSSPPASVLAPAPSLSTAPSSTTSTSTTSTSSTTTSTTPPPTTTPRTTVRATVPATAPVTVPATTTTVATTTTAATTTTTVVNTPPALTALGSSQGTLPTCFITSSTLSVQVTDNSAVVSVVITYSYRVDKLTNASGSISLSGAPGGGVWSGDFTMTTPTTFGTTPVNLTATAVDDQGLSTSIGPSSQYLAAVAPPIC